MSKTRLELKVGLFVTIGLVLLAIMMVQFSKGRSWFRSVYGITLRTTDVGGLRPRAKVQLAGVPVGYVKAIDLAPNGTNVLIDLEVYENYPIHSDARFTIEQSGFLGDQYIAVNPTLNQAPWLNDGAMVECEPPFNLQAVARDTGGLLMQVKETLGKLDHAIEQIRVYALNEQVLTNLSGTVDNLRQASDEARATLATTRGLIQTNQLPIATAVSNLVFFTDQINRFAASANSLLDTNSPNITASVENISESTERLKQLLELAKDGDGLTATLVNDEELALYVSQIVSNLSITTSNLNRRGLWGILWKQKQPKPPSTNKVYRTPRDPFR